MTASTRILLCRLGCIACCFVPTTFIGGWTCWGSTASFAVAQRADWERELTQRLGLVARIGAVSYPALDLARLDNVTLHDPESQQLLASAAIVEVVATSSGWQIELAQPQVQAGGVHLLARAIDQRLLRAPPESLAQCAVRARELSLVHGQSAQSLLEFAARFSPRAAGPELACEFRLPESGSTGGPIRVLLGRHREQAPAVTRWQLDTAGQALPCELLADVLPEFARL